MKYICIALVALSVAVQGRSRAEDTNSTVPQDTVEQVQKDNAKRDFFKIKVTLDSAGKEEASYVAYCSEDPNSKKLYCLGTLAVGDTVYWRLDVEACMRMDRDDAELEISIDDLKTVGKNAEGGMVPQSIFSTRIQSRGPGSYLIGEVQGLTIKVEISEAEQGGGGQPATRPQSK